MTETLQERCNSRGVPIGVDREGGVVRGVKILGLTSRNGRTYLPETLAAAAPLYEEAKVNVNHPKGPPAGPRDYQDRIGVIRNVSFRTNEGLFADFHFNPKHALAEQLLWDAEHAPENVGFSHNVQARTVRSGDQVTVEAITAVQSVDLVADPATTRGLFESRQAALTVETLRRDHPELVEALDRRQAAEHRELEAKVRLLEAEEAERRKRAIVRGLLRECQLPDPETAGPEARPIVSECFLAQVLAAPDDAAMRALIEDRAALVRSLSGTRPAARDPHALYAGGGLDTKAFVEAIT